MILSISKMSIVLCISICHLLSHNSLFVIHSHAIFFFITSPALIIYESSVGHLKLFFLLEQNLTLYPSLPQHLLCNPGCSLSCHLLSITITGMCECSASSSITELEIITPLTFMALIHQNIIYLNVFVHFMFDIEL